MTGPKPKSKQVPARPAVESSGDCCNPGSGSSGDEESCCAESTTLRTENAVEPADGVGPDTSDLPVADEVESRRLDLTQPQDRTQVGKFNPFQATSAVPSHPARELEITRGTEE